MPLRFLLLFLALVGLPGVAQAQLCTHWREPSTVGRLEAARLPEASGLAVSSQFGNRLYHINDSGHGPYFYVTDGSGSGTHQVRIEGFERKQHDPEDLSLGPCDQEQTCLFIADIGDNQARRDMVLVYVIKEEHFGATARPYRRIQLRYPDGARDAEALAVHPSGDLYVLSKEWRFFPLQAAPARLYRLERSRWEDTPEQVHTLTFVGILDLPALNQGRTTPLGHVATSIDISRDGERLLVLTYENALEFGFGLDLAQGLPGELVEGRDYQAIPLRMLPQQEAVAYLLNEKGFLYSTETRAPFTEAELVRVGCLE